MDTIRKAFIAIGAGTMLGFSFWALASWEGMSPIAWIIVGIVIMVSGWLAWMIAGKIRPAPAQPTTPPSEGRAAHDGSGRRSAHQVRVELQAYGLTAFAAVGLLLLAFSQEETEQASLKYLPDSLVIRFSDVVILALASFFFVAALAMLFGAALPLITRWFKNRPGAYDWMEPLAGALAWLGVTQGWLGGTAVARTFPEPLAYSYFFGGFFIWVLVWILAGWNIVEFGRKSARSVPPNDPQSHDAEPSTTTSE